MSGLPARVTRSARLAFGASGLAQNVIGTCLGVHLFVFYTDVVGLSPLWVSGGLFTATLWDAVSDVWMGRLSDRTPTSRRGWRAGRRRPYILMAALPVGVGVVLLLAPPRGLEGAALGLWFTGSLLFLFSAKTVAQVPALSLLPEMARGYAERTRLAASREQLGNVGDLMGLLLPPALMLALGFRGERELAREAFGIAGIVIGALAAGALLITHRGTYEDPRARPSATPLPEALAALRDNAAFRVLLGASCLAALGLAFVQALFLYVLEHVMGEHDPVVHMGAFAVNAGAAICSYPAWIRVSARWGKAAAFRLGLCLSSVAFVSVFFVGPGQRWALWAVMIFSGASNVGFWTLMHALSADVVDLDELTHGERREGLFAGFSALLRKCAFAAAAGGVGVGLWLIGYREQAAQSAETLFGLKLLFAGPPTALVLAALWVFRRFPLTRARQREVRRRLAARPGTVSSLPPARHTVARERLVG